MGSDANRLRRKWQDYSGQNAGQAEKDFFTTLEVLFEDAEFSIRNKPKEFTDLYVDYPLSEQTLNEIYIPDDTITRHGIKPGYANYDDYTANFSF